MLTHLAVSIFTVLTERFHEAVRQVANLLSIVSTLEQLVQPPGVSWLCALCSRDQPHHQSLYQYLIQSCDTLVVQTWEKMRVFPDTRKRQVFPEMRKDASIPRHETRCEFSQRWEKMRVFHDMRKYASILRHEKRCDYSQVFLTLKYKAYDRIFITYLFTHILIFNKEFCYIILLNKLLSHRLLLDKILFHRILPHKYCHIEYCHTEYC